MRTNRTTARGSSSVLTCLLFVLLAVLRTHAQEPAEQTSSAQQLQQKFASRIERNHSANTSPSRLPDVIWLNVSDKFKGIRGTELILRNIATVTPHFFMMVGATENDVSPKWRTNFIAFGQAADASDATLAKDEGILLLDAKKRIYLAGGQYCKSCLQAAQWRGAFSWILADLSGANSIEGRIDGIEFALRAQHLTAVREFVDTRHLLPEGLDPGKFRGKTANEVASDLYDLQRANYDRTRDGFTHLQMISLTDDQFTFSYKVVRLRYEVTAPVPELTLSAYEFLECNQQRKNCVTSVVHPESGSPSALDPTMFGLTIGGQVSSLWGEPALQALSYIDYRLMFCDDHVLFYPSSSE